MERGLIVELVHRQVKGLNIHPEIFVRYRRELVGVEFAGFNEIFEEVLFFVEGNIIIHMLKRGIRTLSDFFIRAG